MGSGANGVSRGVADMGVELEEAWQEGGRLEARRWLKSGKVGKLEVVSPIMIMGYKKACYVKINHYNCYH